MEMSTCPGCGAVLPGPAASSDRRSSASDACRGVYAEVAGYELGHIAELGQWHQLLVDTYGAQHPSDTGPPIGTAFALIGLHLALEDGRSGLEVRDAHQLLGNRYRDWPPFPAPTARARLTIVDLALAGDPSQYVETLHRWAGEVWSGWADQHAAVADLFRDRLPLGTAR
jgi:Family of unknown function (DUF5946)